MSEIIKLYENVGIEKILLCGDRDVLCGHVRPDGKSRLTFGCFECEYKNDVYPSFTAEKQLELIKWLANNKCIEISKQFIDLKNNRSHCVSRRELKFEESLAELVNLIWQDLTDNERVQIKSILDGQEK